MKRKKETERKAWELTDEIWEAAQQFIPETKREEGKTYQRNPGGGRKPLPPRKVLEGIFFVFRTGIQWKAVPKEYGAASSIHDYFSKWAQEGLFVRLWEKGLLSNDELRGTGWEWNSADGCMVKAPLPQGSAGKAAGGGKKGDGTQPRSRTTRITSKYSRQQSQHS